jgi:CRISPR-associated protein Cas1
MLSKLTGDDAGLFELASTVKSGDSGNVEGFAARVYWQRLFGPDFRRDADGFDHNRFLNYGYGVLRAVTCRAICAAGLHPGLGLFHHHRANPFCLADDLMEPFRPLVDEIVFAVWREGLGMAELSPTLKQRLLGVLQVRLVLAGEERSLFDVLNRLSLSLASVLEVRRKALLLPDFATAASDAPPTHPPDEEGHTEGSGP